MLLVPKEMIIKEFWSHWKSPSMTSATAWSWCWRKMASSSLLSPKLCVNALKCWHRSWKLKDISSGSTSAMKGIVWNGRSWYCIFNRASSTRDTGQLASGMQTLNSTHSFSCWVSSIGRKRWHLIFTYFTLDNSSRAFF